LFDDAFEIARHAIRPLACMPPTDDKTGHSANTMVNAC
jgi:hypothetical protein